MVSWSKEMKEAMIRDEIKTVIDNLPESCLFAVRDFLLFEESRYRNSDANENKDFNTETIEAMNNALLGQNLYGPFKTAKEAVTAMLED